MSDANMLIQVKKLVKKYRMGDVEVSALRGVDLNVQKGEFIAIVGPSGSGKSTLFYILGGLASATSGTVLIDGRDLAAMSDTERTAIRRELVGFVFQRYNLLPTLSATDNIAMAQYLAGKKHETDGWFKETLELLGIGHRLSHKPRSLSGGEQQRVAIARAIVNHPALLLADEPTGNLDSENSEIVLKLLRDLNERLGQTILMITHNPEAAAYAHRIVHMRDGRIVEHP
ncbi:MAG: ABC transporter ATP-binding protein [Bryobacterales bacterium]|nr:ABC transporter ATP-binding protein [Bryobacterales bacterium]